MTKRRNREHRQKSQEHVIVNAHYSFVCPYCMRTITNINEACIDHVMPRSRFKETEKILCCKKCNQEKGALTAEEYALWKKLDRIRTGQIR